MEDQVHASIDIVHDAMDSEFTKLLSELSREEKLELLSMWKERKNVCI